MEIEKSLEQGADDYEFVDQSLGYDIESGSEPTISDNEDERTFLRAVTTRIKQKDWN